jgi:hypothetical protein
MHSGMWQIESTLKSRDVEEVIDLYFYRPLGYVIAQMSQAAALTPNAVTIMSIVVGMVAGHFFYYQDLAINVGGIVLLVLAEAMDSADGQLARMTNTKSQFGRIIDGFGGNLIFISIYVHLCFRIMAAGGSIWIFGVAALCGLSHSFQCAMADYYRNAYLFFVHGIEKSELEQSRRVAESYQTLSWRHHPIKRFLMRIFLNYTRQQELVARNFQRLSAAAQDRFGRLLPQWLREDYAASNRPLLKYYNFITTNTRMIALFCSLLINNVFLYFLFELVVLNGVLVVVTIYQERLNARLLGRVLSYEGAA